MLIKNHSSRPTGSTALPEVNANFAHSGRGRGRGRGRGHGRGRGYNSSRGAYGGFKGNKTTNFKKQQKKIEPIKNNDSASENKRHYEEVCYRCGQSGHVHVDHQRKQLKNIIARRILRQIMPKSYLKTLT